MTSKTKKKSEADEPRCSICGEPATLGYDLETAEPYWRCEEHREEGELTRAMKRARLKREYPQVCIVCGADGVVAQITGNQIEWRCAEHADEQAREGLRLTGRLKDD